MKTRLFVGNLDYVVQSMDVRRLFAPFGEIAAVHVFNNGKNRFAFVLMTNEADCESAMEILNGTEFFGRKLLVTWAIKQRRPRTELALLRSEGRADDSLLPRRQ